ncbi:MAG: 1,4-alpha-glucan-branching enzyme, partial [Bacteroidales bacterium]|nr:1,4-alpha-glucan-branching enzyme [Bacteroidales bacterium]
METPYIVQQDPWLKPFESQIADRKIQADRKEVNLTGGQSLHDFAAGHLYFGLHRTPDGWVFREWAPNATSIHLIGDFSGWKELPSYAMQPIGNGCWEINLPASRMMHGDLYKLLIRWKGGEGERLPAYANRTVQDDRTKQFAAQVWAPEEPYRWHVRNFTRKNEAPL